MNFVISLVGNEVCLHGEFTEKAKKSSFKYEVFEGFLVFLRLFALAAMVMVYCAIML